MADYQLIGDAFGYHSGYPPGNSSQQGNASQPGQPNLGMLPGSALPPGQQYHHSLATPRPGYPQTDPLMSHKMHPGYPGYPGAGMPPSAASTSSAIRSQYSQNAAYMPHASMDSYASLSMGQHPGAPPPHQSLGSMAYGQHQSLMSQYPGQRMHTPSPLHGAPPRHPSMPSQYASAYGSTGAQSGAPGVSPYHTGATSATDLWSSGQNISLQQSSPFSSFQSSVAAAAAVNSAAAAAVSSLHSSSRGASQGFGGGSAGGPSDPYGSTSTNPYFTNHLSGDPSSVYPPPPGVYPSVSQSSQSQQSSTSSRSSSSSRSQQQQQQYSSQIGPYGSSAVPPSSSSQQTSSVNSVSSNSAVRFSHHYPSAYPGAMSAFDPSAQARLSPYGQPTQPTPQSGPSNSSGGQQSNQTPNSPQYRSSGYPGAGGSTVSASQLPVLSPRRPTATPPAGSPMPPTSHTPGPPSVGSVNSAQGGGSSQSAFSIAGGNSSSSGGPSSLQQLEQMVMPHIGTSSNSSSSATASSKSTSSASNNNSNNNNSSSNSYFGGPGANSNSPISPQQQGKQQSSSQGLFASHHFAASSPSTQSPQYSPYHQAYSQQGPPPPGAQLQWQQPSAQPSSHNTHQQHKVHSSASSASTASSKGHQAEQQQQSSLHQPYSTYGSSSSSSKAGNQLGTGSDNAEVYSQSFSSSSNSHSSHSPHHSSSSIPVSQHTLPQSGYSNNISNSLPTNAGLSSYETLGTPKQSSLKNDTQQMQFDHSKASRSSGLGEPGDPMNSMSGPGQQSQMTSLNSNSYHHPMMQGGYGPGQPMSAYSSQPRHFDHHSMSNQYGGMSSELSNSSYDPHSAGGDASSMMGAYDPYNIDNSLGIPPHQSMSEYRESQANMQSGSDAFAQQNDPYAANFDDFETTAGGKRKGKGRPKKDASAAPPKKERKPRQPRAPSTRGTGRGRGRGAKNAAAERLPPIPGLMPEYGDASSAMPYGMGPMGHPPGGPLPGSDPMDMYGSSVDMYGSGPGMGPGKMMLGGGPHSGLPPPSSLPPLSSLSSDPSMMGHSLGGAPPNSLPPSVLSSQQPPMSDLIGSPYGAPPPSLSSQQQQQIQQQQQQASQQLSQQQVPQQSLSQQQLPPASLPPASQMMSNSLAPPPMSGPLPPQQVQQTLPPTSSYDPMGVPAPPQPPLMPESTYPSYMPPEGLSNSEQQSQQLPSMTPLPPSSSPSSLSTPLCDNNSKELSQDPRSLSRPTSSQSNYDDSHHRFMSTSATSDSSLPVGGVSLDPSLAAAKPEQHSSLMSSMGSSNQLTAASTNDDVDMADMEKQSNKQMSFNSSMDNSCPPPPLPPIQQMAPGGPQSVMGPYMPTPMFSPEMQSSTHQGYPPSNAVPSMDQQMGQLDPSVPMNVCPPEMNTENKVMNNNFDMISQMPMVPPPPHHLMPPLGPPPTMDPYSSSFYPEDPNMVSLPPFASSTPIAEPKAKKPKKRRSKKAEEPSMDMDIDSSAIKDETAVVSEPKPKKKRVKKPKVVVEEPPLENCSSMFSDLTDDKTQLSTFDSMISSEAPSAVADTPAKPKRSAKKRAKPKPKVAVEPLDSTMDADLNATIDDVTADLNGDVSNSQLELPPEPEKPKKPKVKSKSPKKKMPKLALKLKSNKKRRRGFGSPDNSDVERTPPPSPLPEDDCNKRRSARNTKRQRYNDEIDIDLSDEDFMDKKKGEDTNVSSIQLTEDTMVVEKILSTRMGKRELELEPEIPPPPPPPAPTATETTTPETEGEEKAKENGSDAPPPVPPAPQEPEPVFIDVEEFYVKYKNLSYLHCDWKTEEELEKGDRRISQKIKRYRQKKDINVFDFLDEEAFNPDYIEVDRVLDVNEIEEIVDDDEDEELQSVLAATAPKSPPPAVTETKSVVEDDKKSEKDEKDEMEVDKTLEIPADKEKEITASEETVAESLDKAEVKDENSATVEESVAEEATAKVSTAESTESTSAPAVEKAVSHTEEDDNKTESSEGGSASLAPVEPTPATPVSLNPARPKEKKKKTRIVRHYLVKWRGLSYEESTWELEDDIDPEKIQHFYRFRNPPPRKEWKITKRPKASEWKKLPASPVYKNGNTLREYQLEGVNWLNFCWHNGQNCILADEMGLGKTIQSITFVQAMVDYGVPYPYLIIVPLSTIGNWQREFETWTDLNVVTYHGSSPSRNMLQEYELYYKNEKNERIPSVYKFQVMITTFEVILSDCLELSQIKWVACIIDEAHRLKNRNCKLLEGLRMLNIEHRVLLSGTPLQNNVEELYSLLHFLEPTQFASNDNFLSEFGDLKTEAQVDKLKAILKPMMLRRLKEDVEKSLAPKEETIIEVELTNVQKKYYRAILERNFAFLSKGGTYANMPNLMNTVMELRKCCIHPFLINGAEEQIIHEYRQQHTDDGTLTAIVQASGKLVLIDKLLPKLKENGHRVLIFSQMVRCLDILEDYLCQKRYPFERIDGRVRGNLRQAAIDRFSKPDSDRFVFLLCTRAGGLGINLTAADTVIIFDSDWNPQNDLQAQARCHRIGQKKSVKVYRLICRNTYEREMFDRASLKLGLDKAVLQSINAQRSNLPDNQLSKKEIEDLLRKGAYGALMDDDNAGDKFCEEDIDIILQRRTKKIIIESEGKGGSFSKASFATSDNRTDIEIDDPNFWEKWAKKANFDLDELKNRNELIVQEPRRRTQTKRFGADDAMLDITDLETSTDDEEASISTRTRGSRNKPINGKGGKRRKGRPYDFEDDGDYAQEIGFGWTRTEFFRVEKALLTYGWGRWDECLKVANFKRDLHEQDVEDISRIVLLFSLQNYKGDERVKSYVLELITPPDEKCLLGGSTASESDIACKSMDVLLDAPGIIGPDGVLIGGGGGRRGKKSKIPTKSVGEELETLDWAKNDKYNPEVHLSEEYRKHLLRHANKILLRVRLLTYIKNEIIGDLHDKIMSSCNVREIGIACCPPDTDPPVGWWDEEADKSLVIGVYKHGYDRFNLMRTDASLCFLARCGPPDGAALLAELSTEFDEGKTLEEDEPDTPATPATPMIVDSSVSKEDKVSPVKDEEGKPSENKDDKSAEAATQYLPFPNGPELNNRLRRLVTSYQRNFKKEEARIAQKARHQQRIERIEKFEAVMRAKEMKKREQAQKKWSRREEADFYRIVSSFGVDYHRKTETFEWGRFRMYAKLERKMDETLTEYFKAFYSMCKKVVGRHLTEDEENLPISVDPITEEKANRCLARIDLLSKVREEIIFHPELDERMKLCQSQLDLPDWWVCGKHDKDLLLGVAKYGFFRLDFNLMNDPELSFMEVVRSYELPAPLDGLLGPKEQPFIDVEVENEIKSFLNSLIEKVDDKEKLSVDEQMEVDEQEAEKEKDSSDEKSAAKSEPELSETKAGKENVAVKKEDDESAKEKASADKPLTNGDSAHDESKELCSASALVKPADPEAMTSFSTSLNGSGMLGTTHLMNSLNQPLRGTFKWPRDRVLQLRLENICVAVEKNEWPIFRGINSIMQHSTTPSIATADSSPRPSTPCSLSSASQEHTPHPTPDHTPRRESQSPFTPADAYTFYPNNASGTGSAGANSTTITNTSNIFDADTTRRRRRRRRKFEMENDRNNKLHSLLNQYETPSSMHSLQQQQSKHQQHQQQQHQQQQHHRGSNASSSKQQQHQSQYSALGSQSAVAAAAAAANSSALSALAQQLLGKSQPAGKSSSAAAQSNALFNNNFLAPLLANLHNLPANIRNVLRDVDLFDEKTSSLLLGNSMQFAAAAAAKAKSGGSGGIDQQGSSKQTGSGHSGPPPAHQSSSSRNSLPLSSLDLTSKFKNASTNSALEKAALSAAAAVASGRSNLPYPAHSKQMNKNLLSDKADVLDLSSMGSGSSGSSSKQDPKTAITNFLSQSLQKSLEMKNSSMLAAAQQAAQQSSMAAAAAAAAQAAPTPTRKGKGKIGSRIDQLALNLQAKKMMETDSSTPSKSHASEVTASPVSLLNKSQAAQAIAAATAARMPKGLNDKDLLAALSSLGSADKRANLFDEFSKAALHSAAVGGKSKSGSMSSANSMAAAAAASSAALASILQQQQQQQKKQQSVDANKAPAMSFLDSLKLFSSAKNAKDQNSFMQKNFKSMLEEHPELLTGGASASLSSLLSASPLLSQNPGSLAAFTSPNSSSQQGSNIMDAKKQPSRSSKRSRAQFAESQSPMEQSESPASKRANMLSAASKAPSLDPKNPNFSKYLTSLLDGKNDAIETKIKNFINDKSTSFKDFKTPVSMPSNTSSGSNSSIRTRTSDKRASSSATSSSSASSTNFGNLNASNLLNSLSMAAASASGASANSKQQQQQQQQQSAANLLASTYANFAANSNKSSTANQFSNSASQFANHNLGFNPQMLASFPSMKMILDAAAAAAAGGVKSSSGSSTSTTSTSSTTSASNASAANAAAAASSMSSFANLFGGMNPLLNFGNLASLGFGQAGSAKKADGTGGVDFSSLFANANLSASLAGGGSDDKSKSQAANKAAAQAAAAASAASNASNSSKGGNKSGLSPAAAAAMLGQSGLGASLPFLYSNPNFNPMALYNPLGQFGISSPFLNNPNIMNGLANFSNVFTSTTPTMSSTSSNPPSRSSRTSTAGSRANTKVASSGSGKGGGSSTTTSSASATASSASGLSLSSGLLATGGSASAPGAANATNSTLDSDDESLKSLMGHGDDDDDLNGDFESAADRAEEPKAKRSRSSKSSHGASQKSKRSKN